MKTKPNSIVVLVDNCRGRYAWQSLATNYPINGLTEADIAILKSGPDTEGHDDIVDDAMFHGVTVSIGDAVYSVQTNDNGDLLGIPSHWEHDDATDTWGPPESDTLKRYTLPSHWACPVLYGDFSGLTDEEEKEIDAFFESEGIAHWTLSDVSENTWFAHRNDAGTLAGDVSRFTFVRIP